MKLRNVLKEIWKPLIVIVGVFMFSTTGFVLTQRVSWFTGFYWGLTTLSTVGYGDVVPTNTYSRLFAMVLMVTTIGVIGYLVSSITMLAMRARDEELLGSGGTKLTGHVILLGWTPTARTALRELILSGQSVAVMTRQHESIVEIHTFVTDLIEHYTKNPALRGTVSKPSDIYIGYGDYTEKSALTHLNLGKASRAIVASHDDAHNVMTSLILKELAPQLRIVVALVQEQFRETLVAAGITYVISPAEMGGRVLAEAAVQPEVAITFEKITNRGNGVAFDEYELRAGSPLVGKPFGEAISLVQRHCDSVLLGIAKPVTNADRSRFQVAVAPPAATLVNVGDYALIIASNGEGRARVEHYLGVAPGRERRPTSDTP